MSSESPTRISTDDQPSIQVSLAGASSAISIDTADSSLTSAIDDALTKLGEVTDGISESGGATTPPGFCALIEAMVTASSRREAAMRLVERISAECNDCTVRCGLGKHKLNHLLDSRLGWLGADSSLFQEHTATWETPRRRSDDPSGEVACVVRNANRIEIHLPQHRESGRCVIWIESKGNPANRLAWMSPVVGLVGAVLWSRPAHSWPSVAARIVQKSYVLLASIAVFIAVLAIWPVHYRIPCTARVETTHQRLVATPFEATLLQTNVKPGDTVKQGEVLVVLDGRPLRLELEAVEAEIQQVDKEQNVALVSGRIAEAQQSALKKQQLQRQQQLIRDRLGRLEVVSPIDGVVVSGDLEKYVGSPLELGQMLIEVAPMDRMIIEVEIPEHEIGYVRQGADARVKIDAIGGESIHAPLDDVYPSAEVRDDRNVFIGRIELGNAEMQLKPGMRGKATTYGPLRPWIWSWVRGTYERVLWWIGY